MQRHPQCSEKVLVGIQVLEGSRVRGTVGMALFYFFGAAGRAFTHVRLNV